MNDTLLENYFATLPALHTWDGHSWNSGGFDEWHLRELVTFIRSEIPTDARILETGAGNTTISFLLTDPKEVVSIAPDAALFKRITDYCDNVSISYVNLKAICGPSELELPRLADSGAKFDFALIDGKHGWPAPFVDLCYSNYMVGRGGFIMIDDVQIKPCKEVASFLAMQPGYEIVKNLQKAVIFKKITDDLFIPDWEFQPYCMGYTRLLPEDDRYSLYSPEAAAPPEVPNTSHSEIDELRREVARVQRELDLVKNSRRYRLAERLANTYNQLFGR